MKPASHAPAVARAGADVEAVITELERLANVSPGALRGVLLRQWAGAGHVEAARRLEEARKDYVRRAAQARRDGSVLESAGVRSVVAELLRLNPKWNKTRAFEHIAESRCVMRDSVRNAYYRRERSPGATGDHSGDHSS